MHLKLFGNRCANIVITESLNGVQKFGSFVQARVDAENVQSNEMMPSNIEPDFDEEFERKLELGEDITPKTQTEAPTQVCSATLLMGDRSNKETLELLA